MKKNIEGTEAYIMNVEVKFSMQENGRKKEIRTNEGTLTFLKTENGWRILDENDVIWFKPR